MQVEILADCLVRVSACGMCTHDGAISIGRTPLDPGKRRRASMGRRHLRAMVDLTLVCLLLRCCSWKRMSRAPDSRYALLACFTECVFYRFSIQAISCLAMKPIMPNASTKNSTKVPSLPAFDSFARSQMTNSMKKINAVSPKVIPKLAICASVNPNTAVLLIQSRGGRPDVSTTSR